MMKRITLLMLTILISFIARAHREPVDILDTQAAKAVVLVKIAGEVGRYESAEKGFSLLERATNEASKVEDKAHKESALAKIANEYAALGDIDKALEISRLLENTHFQVTNLGKIANKLAGHDNAKAEKLLEEALEKARKSASSHDLPALLGELSGKYVKLGKTNIARELLDEALLLADNLKDIELDDHLSIYAEIAANLSASGQNEKAFVLFEKAYQLSHKIENPFDRAAILAMLGGELAEKGHPEKSKAILMEALKVSALIPNLSQRNDITSEIGRNFSQAKECHKAMEIGQSINDPYYASECLLRTAKNFYKIKDEQNAGKVLLMVEQKAATISASQKRAMVLAKTASEFGGMGNKAEALKLLDEAIKILG